MLKFLILDLIPRSSDLWQHAIAKSIMNDSIEIKINYTTEDFARSLPFIQAHVFKRKYWIYILPVGTFLGIIGLMNSMSYKEDTPNYTAMIILAAVPALIMFVVVWILDKKARWISENDKISPWAMNREASKLLKKNPRLGGETTMTVSNKGINSSSASFSENLEWIMFTKSIESDSDIFLFTVANDVRFIPKRALESEEQKNLLYRLIKRNLGGKADLSL